jgi:hypothetical protein
MSCVLILLACRSGRKSMPHPVGGLLSLLESLFCLAEVSLIETFFVAGCSLLKIERGWIMGTSVAIAVGFDTSAHLLFASLFVLQGRSWFLQESAHDRAPKDMIMSLLNRCMRSASCYEPDCEPLRRCCLICSRVKLERERRPSLL